MKKRVSVILLLTVMLVGLAGCLSGCGGMSSEATASSEAPTAGKSYTILDDLNSKEYRLVVETGSACALAAMDVFPKAELVYSNMPADCFKMVQDGKVDGYVCERVTYEKAVQGNTALAKDLTVLNGKIGTIDIAVGIPKERDDFLRLVNRFIMEIKADGTLDDIRMRWIDNGITDMPDIEAPENPTQKYIFATCGFLEPWSYTTDNNELSGMDVELIRRFALYANADIEIQTMGFDALLASLESGRVDAVLSDLNITEERAKVIDYSTPYYVSQIVVCTSRSLARISPEALAALPLSYLNGRKIGIAADSPYRKTVCNTFSESSVAPYADSDALITDLKNYALDIAAVSEPEALRLAAEDEDLLILDSAAGAPDNVYLIGDASSDLRARLNIVLEKYHTDGTMDRLKEKWITADDAEKQSVDDFSGSSAPNGVLNISIVSGRAGMCFINNKGQLAGYDVELITMAAKELGYSCFFTETDRASVEKNVADGKADIGIGGFTADETEQLCTVTTVSVPCRLIMLNPDTVIEKASLFQRMKESLYRTFIEESRWKSVLRGIYTTLVITVLSAITGTALGVIFCILLRSRVKFIRTAAQEISSLLSSTPIVVILMVLYYLVFANSTAAPIFVAVIGFSLDFANTVGGLLKTGIDALGVGQIEAAKTLGFSRSRTFFNILLPQAARNMFQPYRASVISLIRSTAVVGYITVEDLTRVSDIIRSRTFEAFFPLITTAIIYIILARIIIFILTFVDNRLDPAKRRNIRILREVDKE